MITNLTKQDLVDFELDILRSFENKEIRAPIHLSSDEDQLLEIFKNIRKQDWVCSTWRSHYHCLLKGVPPELVKKKILAGHSISLCFKDYKIISSAIVGGICPIALGLAWAAKEQKKDEKVFCFIGETSAMTGGFWESYRYGLWHNLPIEWIVADNGLSVCSPTTTMWNYKNHPATTQSNIHYYVYTSKFPHSGGTKRVNF